MLKTKIETEKTITKAELLDEGDIIFGEAMRYIKRQESAEKAFTEIKAKHKEFCTAYPSVFSLMLQGMYARHVMSMYISYVKANPWISEDKFIESQAMYVKMLYKHTHKNIGHAELNDVYERSLRSIKAESERIKRLEKAARKKVDAREKELTDEYKDDLMRYMAENEAKIREMISSSQ
jgi:hypothetical protein